MKALLILAHLFYAQECCHEQHCHPVPCKEVIDLGSGWQWQGNTFARAMLRVSPDGDCHVCIAAAPICIYLPPKV